MAEFELDYGLTREDLRAYRRSYMRRFQREQTQGLGSSVSMVSVLLLAGLSLATGLGLLQSYGLAPFASPFSSILGFAAGVAAVMIWASSWTHRMEDWSYAPDGYTLGARRLKATDDGVEVTGANFQQSFRWSAFEGFTECGDVVLLWLDRSSALIVPARAFGDALVRRAFLAFMRRNMAPSGAREPQRAFA